MDTTSCPYCGGAIQPEAIKCRHCKSDLVKISYTPADNSRRSIALSLISFLLIVYIIIGSLVQDEWSKDGAAGMLMFTQVALLTGVISVTRRMGYRALAIISIILSGITFFALLEILTEL